MVLSMELKFSLLPYQQEVGNLDETYRSASKITMGLEQLIGGGAGGRACERMKYVLYPPNDWEG